MPKRYESVDYGCISPDMCKMLSFLTSRGGGDVRIWAKYLIIGWSAVSVAIVIVSFQLMKSQFVEEDYGVTTVYKLPEKTPGTSWELIGESLFHNNDISDSISITKKEFVDRMKKAKGVVIESKTKIKDKTVYLLLPLYAFAVWIIPILVFSLVGLLFSRKTESK